ncbi:hypothetical protein NKR23_g11191 [Pleurostoma richardsiae]|uniref:Uncharacterized protein n=1 Tax=Pleurostoma richardsiae TaxID=41990 RepID=A0AA38VBK4_9PEZI|nr:hypothetical protein NKR23_g11191 [Pleurostoma richardsiae]
MARSLAAILLLAAQGAVATLPIPTPNALAAVVAAATETDDGLLACVTAEALEAYCFDAYPDFTDLPAVTQAACLCCYSASNVADTYGSCADYISESSMRQYSTEYTVQSAVQEFCFSQGNVCGGALPTATATATSTSEFVPASTTTTTSRARATTSATTSASGSDDVEPEACTSAAYIVASCSQSVDDFTDLPARSQASCVCYSGSTYTTAFDDYVASCATYISTASPDIYTDYASLTTFCEDYTPAATTSSSPRSTSSPLAFGTTETTATRSSSSTSSSTSPTATTTVTVQAGGGSSATTTTAAAALAARDGPVGWAVNGLTFLLSFFFLI